MNVWVFLAMTTHDRSVLQSTAHAAVVVMFIVVVIMTATVCSRRMKRYSMPGA